MTNSNQTTRFALITGMIVLAAFTRLIPHWPNFTAVLAIALFGGAKFRNAALAIIIPLIAMLITDLSYAKMQFGSTNLFIGHHSLMPLVYGCIAVTSLIGIYVGKKANTAFIIGGSLVSS